MVTTSKKALESITKWLAEDGLLKEERETEGHHFNISAEYPEGSGWQLSIVQRKENKDKITFISGMSVDKSLNEALGKKGMEQLMKDFRFGLLNMEGHFNMKTDGDDLTNVTLTDSLYYDSLTKTNLMKAIDSNWRKFLFTTWTLQERISSTKK